MHSIHCLPLSHPLSCLLSLLARLSHQAFLPFSPLLRLALTQIHSMNRLPFLRLPSCFLLTLAPVYHQAFLPSAHLLCLALTQMHSIHHQSCLLSCILLLMVLTRMHSIHRLPLPHLLFYLPSLLVRLNHLSFPLPFSPLLCLALTRMHSTCHLRVLAPPSFQSECELHQVPSHHPSFPLLARARPVIPPSLRPGRYPPQ